MDKLEGYRGKLRHVLEKADIVIGDKILIKKRGIEIKGILMPSISREDDIIFVKLENGYNIGIRYKDLEIEKVESIIREPREIKGEPKEGEVMLISTGGTIASKVEYTTGAVRPALSVDEIIEFVPEVKDIAKITVEVLFSILSENMKPEYWSRISEKVYESLVKEYKGVVIAHGTDTMAYTSSALSFSLRRINKPILIVGSQRSSDRPSSDASLNLLSALFAAKNSDLAEVGVVMHGEPSDSYVLVHRGTKVRKMHTSRRDAFQTINGMPLMKIIFDERRIIQISNYRKRNSDVPEVYPRFDERVFLLKIFPGISEQIVYYLVDKGYKGIIVEGTGLGHSPENFIEAFKYANDNGVIVGMSSQCIFGRVNMNVYTTGRLLLRSGVLPLSDMLPETALVKLMWGLANIKDLDELRRFMLTNVSGEINDRELMSYFPRWNHGN